MKRLVLIFIVTILSGSLSFGQNKSDATSTEDVMMVEFQKKMKKHDERRANELTLLKKYIDSQDTTCEWLENPLFVSEKQLKEEMGCKGESILVGKVSCRFENLPILAASFKVVCSGLDKPSPVSCLRDTKTVARLTDQPQFQNIKSKENGVR